MQITLSIENLGSLRDAFSKAPKKMTDALNTAIKQSIFTVQREAQINTPVRTGRLRASYTSTFTPLEGDVGPTANYAIYVHDGTRYMRARPFLTNAVKTVESQVEGFFQKAIQSTLDDIARDAR